MRWKRTCELDFFSRASPADSLYEVPKPFNAFNLSIYSDGQILRTSFGKKTENRHSGDVLSMGFKKSS